MGTKPEGRISLTDHTIDRVKERSFMGNPPGAEGAAMPHDSFFVREKVPRTEQATGSETLHAREISDLPTGSVRFNGELSGAHEQRVPAAGLPFQPVGGFHG